MTSVSEEYLLVMLRRVELNDELMLSFSSALTRRLPVLGAFQKRRNCYSV